jgi:hypothetical protein
MSGREAGAPSGILHLADSARGTMSREGAGTASPSAAEAEAETAVVVELIREELPHACTSPVGRMKEGGAVGSVGVRGKCAEIGRSRPKRFTHVAENIQKRLYTAATSLLNYRHATQGEGQKPRNDASRAAGQANQTAVTIRMSTAVAAQQAGSAIR